MKTGLLTLLLLGAVSADAAAVDYAPLRSYVNSLAPEFVLGAVGDSWICNAQFDGESVAWGSDIVGSVAPYRHNLIWADPTASHGATVLGNLAWRLRTHRHVTEAIGGAGLATSGIPLVWKQDSTIIGWVDNLADFHPQVVIGYGGINDILNLGRTYAQIKPRVLEFARVLLEENPAPVPVIIPTLQPCGKAFFHYKIHNSPSSFGALTWRAALDTAVYLQDIQFDVNTFIMDSLRSQLAAEGYDTTRVFPYDHFGSLAGASTWVPGGPAADYPLDISSVPGATLADSTRWARLRFVRQEIEWDSIHVSQKGLRQIGDTMAVRVFGVDLLGWTPGLNRTLFVDKQAGHNWNNRLVATLRDFPLASLQCAISRAWPGDTIRVIGQGNQSLLATDDVTGLPVSAVTYEVAVNKPHLKIICEPGSHFQGMYSATAAIHGHSPRAKGVDFLNEDASSGGDGKEIPANLREFPGSPVFGTWYPTISLDLSFDGLTLSGYNNPWSSKNVDGLHFENCRFTGGKSATGFRFDNFGTGLDLKFKRCTFYCDSSAGSEDNNARYGGVNVGAMSSSAGDTCRFTGSFDNCLFLGREENAAQAPVINGLLDGMVIAGCVFTCPIAYRYGTISYNRTEGMTGNVKLVNNTFNIGGSGEKRLIFSAELSGNDIDSLILINNLIDFSGEVPYPTTVLYRGAYAPSRSWIARNVLTSSDMAISAAGVPMPLAALVEDGAAPALEDPGNNWIQPVRTDSDSVLFGGVLETCRGPSCYRPQQYGVSFGGEFMGLGSPLLAPRLYLPRAVPLTITVPDGDSVRLGWLPSPGADFYFIFKMDRPYNYIGAELLNVTTSTQLDLPLSSLVTPDTEVNQTYFWITAVGQEP